jgi:hypothetical protein
MSDRGKAQARRQTDAYKQARKMYLKQPQVAQMRRIKSAIKKHRLPPSGVQGY